MPHFPHVPPASNATRILYSLTGGVGLIALLVGFGECAFDLSKVDQCADYAIWVTEQFKIVGDYLIQWGIAMFRAILAKV